MSNRDVSIIIPNWNGRDLLEKNIPLLFKALQKYEGQFEVIVVDDGSTDDSIDFIRSRYPEITLVALEENRGFAIACNKGVEKSKFEIVYMLNSDIEVLENFLESSMKNFLNEDVFAVTSKEVPIDLDNLRSDTITLPQIRYGILMHVYRPIKFPMTEPIPAYFVSGGRTAYDKEKFLKLGGFDDLYRPFYLEDLDICYRAWKRGWGSYNETKSLVRHQCQSSIRKKFSKKEIDSIYWKNLFLFFWKNIRWKRLILIHLFFLPFVFVFMFVKKRNSFNKGFLMFLRQIKEVKRKRNKEAKMLRKYSDKELFQQFKILEKRWTT